MGLLIELGLWASVLALGVFICRGVIDYSRYMQLVRQNGCSLPPKYPHKDPLLGLDLFLEQFRAMKRGDSGRTERERFRRYGKTFEANSWGTRCVHTMDTANIQVILAQCFDSFGVEPMRLHIASLSSAKAFSPLTGLIGDTQGISLSPYLHERKSAI